MLPPMRNGAKCAGFRPMSALRLLFAYSNMGRGGAQQRKRDGAGEGPRPPAAAVTLPSQLYLRPVAGWFFGVVTCRQPRPEESIQGEHANGTSRLARGPVFQGLKSRPRGRFYRGSSAPGLSREVRGGGTENPI